MRLRFDQQIKIDITPISEVELNLKSRHGLVPVLRALQYVFKTKELNEQIFGILEKKVGGDLQKTGRYGMSLWEILVLCVVRLTENADFDQLHDLSNEHNALRGILGIQKNDYTKGKEYSLQSIKDNFRLLDDATIYELSEIVVSGSHGLIKKKEGVDCLNLQIKGDSFVVESNIHFPTDLNLLWDSLRKVLETMGCLQQYSGQLFSTCHRSKWLKKARSKYRSSSEIHRKKGRNYEPRLEKSVTEYLEVGRSIEKRAKLLIAQIAVNESFKEGLTKVGKDKLNDLLFYQSMVTKHLDLVNRRILLKEKIPHSEKIFSIFEEHVEWNSKGKANKLVELGHNVLIATDQYHFILHGEVYEHQVDKQRTIALGKKLEEKYQSTEKLESISLDRNFYSLPAETDLSKRFKIVVLPKSGRKSKLELAQSENAEYQKLKQSHSGIEGNINQLEQNGLDICRDKGIVGFKRYVAYGILSYNLHRMGKLLILADRAGLKKRRKPKRIALAA